MPWPRPTSQRPREPALNLCSLSIPDFSAFWYEERRIARTGFVRQRDPIGDTHRGWEMTLATYEGDNRDLPRKLADKIGPWVPEAVALAEFGGDDETGLAVDFSIGRLHRPGASQGLRFSLLNQAGETLASFVAELEGTMTINSSSR